MHRTIVCLTILVATLNSCENDSKGKQSTLVNTDTAIKGKTMQDQNFSTTIFVDQSPTKVFDAVNNVRGWWSEQIEGSTDSLNAEFDYHYKDVHRCTMRIVEFIPNEKVFWLVLDNYFNFTKDQSEWKNTKVSFNITKEGSKTKLVFTHIGLVPSYECYNICSDAWGNYITGSLRSLIETGKGKPNPYEPAIKKAEVLKSANQ